MNDVPTFGIEKHGEKYMPVGRIGKETIILAEKIMLDGPVLAKAIALNMQSAFDAGIVYAKKTMTNGNFQKSIIK